MQANTKTMGDKQAQTGRHRKSDRQADRKSGIHTYSQAQDKETGMKKDRWKTNTAQQRTETHTDRHTDR